MMDIRDIVINILAVIGAGTVGCFILGLSAELGKDSEVKEKPAEKHGEDWQDWGD